MRAGLTACVVLAATALLGLTPLEVFGADPSSPGAAGAAPAAAGATEQASTPTGQDASARRQEKSARPHASARENAPVGRQAPSRQEHTASGQRPGSGRPDRGVPRQVRGVPAGPPLDLTTPPINHVMTPEQVQALISAPDEAGPQDVMVEEDRYEAPVPRGQIRALAWALLHPLEAWRIFTPVTDQ